MRKNIFILLLILTSIHIPVTSQQYFNNRFGFGITEGADSGFDLLETEDGYVISGATDGYINPDFYRYGLAKVDFYGNMVKIKSWGSTNSIWYSTPNGSLIRKSGSFYTINANRSSIMRKSALIKYNNSLDTINTNYYKKTYYPFDSTYISRCFIETGTGFMITGTLEMIFSDNINNKS